MNKKEKQIVNKALYAALVKNILLTNALSEVVNSWEQGGTPCEIDAAMNRAAITLGKVK